MQSVIKKNMHTRLGPPFRLHRPLKLSFSFNSNDAIIMHPCLNKIYAEDSSNLRQKNKSLSNSGARRA